MKIKIVSCLLAALLLLGLLAGCSDNETSETADTQSTGESQAPVAPGSPEDLADESHYTGETINTPDGPIPDLKFGCTWRSEREAGAEESKMIRELILRYDEADFALRCGEPDSEFFYWARGSWTLKGNRLHLEGTEADERGTPLSDKPVTGDYSVAFQDGKLILTQVGEAAAMREEPGTQIVFELREADN